MSILIVGIEKPINCRLCFASDDESRFCRAAKEYIPMRGKPKFCPLIELPDHGDLIDRDALMKHECYVPLPLGNLPVIYRSYVKGAPVVIPAERREDETD